MKKISLILLMIFLLTTIANAASINGDFKGNPIVKVKSNGKDLAVENTPAVIYNDNTLVPIYMLKQLGATVTWNQKTYSVDVSMPVTQPNKTITNSVQLTKDIISLGGAGVTLVEINN